jgi:hypothetical protein
MKEATMQFILIWVLLIGVTRQAIHEGLTPQVFQQEFETAEACALAKATLEAQLAVSSMEANTSLYFVTVKAACIHK